MSRREEALSVLKTAAVLLRLLVSLAVMTCAVVTALEASSLPSTMAATSTPTTEPAYGLASTTVRVDTYDLLAQHAPHASPARQARYDLGRERISPAPTSLSAARVVAAEDALPEVIDPAASRVGLRVGTKQAIQDAAPRTADGDFIDPNTGQAIPQEGPFDYGHTPGNEWWRTQQTAREQGWTRQQVIEHENDPSHYQIEDPSSNRGHRYEMP